MWFGKIIAGLIGLAVGGPTGLIIGVIAGHYFDRGLAKVFRPLSANQRSEIEAEFFRTVFLLLGKLAKADGRISEVEIAHTEQLMAHMGLHSDHRREAIALFKEGAGADFDIEEPLRRFRHSCGRHPALSRQLLNYLLALALADGALSPPEEAVLRQIGRGHRATGRHPRVPEPGPTRCAVRPAYSHDPRPEPLSGLQHGELSVRPPGRL